MPYCTQQNMIDRFSLSDLIELTDRTQLGEIDTAVLDAAINDATGDMDVYLSTRYTLPLASVPEVLTRLCCDIARYYLYEQAPEQITKRYEAAINLLSLIAKGEINLTVGETTGSVVDVAYQADGVVFDESQNWP